MVRIKRHGNMRNHQEIKRRPRKPNIPELVYKFLGANEADTERGLVSKCCCQKKHHDEVIDSTSRIIGRSMGYKARKGRRKDSGRISKLHNAKRYSISKDLPISYLQKCVDGEGTKRIRKYMKKALDFGVESGYLIPSDPTYKILRVSSDLMKSNSRRNKISTCDTALPKNRNTPTKLEDLQEQKKRRRRRGRRQRSRRGQRSRSGSRTRRRSKRRIRRRRSVSRSRKHNSPQNPEEVAEDEANDYEMDEDDPKSNIHTDDIEREPKTALSNQPDGEQSTKKAEENGSDLSMDEDETDDEDEKKSVDNTKS